MFKKLLQEIKYSQQITLIFLSILLFAVALGINAVSFPALLDQHHVTATKIGIAFTYALISFSVIFGSLIGGVLLNIFSEIGFPITIILSCILYLSFLVIYEKTQKKFIS